MDFNLLFLDFVNQILSAILNGFLANILGGLGLGA